MITVVALVMPVLIRTKIPRLLPTIYVMRLPKDFSDGIYKQLTSCPLIHYYLFLFLCQMSSLFQKVPHLHLGVNFFSIHIIIDTLVFRRFF